MANETVTRTTDNPLAEAGDWLEHAITLVDFMMEAHPGDDPDAQRLHKGAVSLWGILAEVKGRLEEAEARA